MKTTLKSSALLLVLGVALSLMLSGCANVLHNGTQMTITKVKVVGLPSGVYAAGQRMAFSFNDGNGNWIHGTPSKLSDPQWSALVDASGNWELDFSPAMVFTSGKLQFLLIDPTMNWNTLKVDKKVSGKSGGDVILDNPWTPNVSVVGIVNGDDVTWSIQ